ncbi:GNAT family N-acetyltransferase [Shimia sagamensis]|uniref:Acetyltransferase n=1 Tax=Shimia sagamensis TaxID=1566352 RepID=A0ABY1NTH2_9RHOB|nr:GNAT family N-acetyltransferase [Shimia sagamensis]SMP17511.1 putative acetyltransferase [Shimia sagamensis]
MSTIRVAPGNPRDAQATALLRASHALMQALFSEEDNHFLSIDDLCEPNVRFFVAKEENTSLGCVALAFKGDYAEIKSMFVHPDARGKGIAHKLMQAIEAEVRTHGISVLKLETGDSLHQAHSLYRAHGYVDCGPFGDYRESPASLFMAKTLV